MTPPNPSPVPFRRRQRLALGLLLALPFLWHPPAHAQTNPEPGGPAGREEPVVLNPFEVQTTSDKGYGALNSNSITAFNTELDKIPVSADVFDQAFMDDTGFTTIEQILGAYSAGSGSFSLSPDTSASNSQYLDRNGNNTLSIHGLQAPTAMINGFFPAGTGGLTGIGITSNFNLEKVEVINGPQALLYGVSGAGGVLDYTTKQARLGVPSFGALKYQVDEYGHKLGQIDYGTGTDRFAVRLALIDQTVGARRVNIGGPMQGAYLQIAVRPFQNTVIRVSLDQQSFDRLYFGGANQPLTASSTSNDARNGQSLRWLLATGQLQAAANGGASGAGAIPGINWDNVDSLGGVFNQEYRDHHDELITADTRWTKWLSSQVAAGYSINTDARYNGSTVVGFDAPNVSSNPTGTWAEELSGSQESVLYEPSRQKVARVALLADNQLFDGKLHSQTIAGADTTRSDSATISAFYVQADSNWNIVSNTTGTNNGYIDLPSFYWAVPGGPVQQPAFNPTAGRITYNGVNYVRVVTNGTSPSLISPSNPEGLTGHGSGDFRHTTDIDSGYYFANYTDFFGGNLTTLAGARFGKAYYRNDVESSVAATPSVLSEADAKFTDLDGGINFRIVGNLRAYAEVSESENPPTSAAADPYGNQLKVSSGFGEEVGLKETLPRWNLSGSLSLYHTKSKNEELAFTSTIVNDINPSGLNGVYSSPSDIVNVNRQSQGAQITMTAAPGNWRLRLSAATGATKVETGTRYAQLYNDQFHEDSQGDVTYADGSLVYVAPTYNSKATIAAPASTAPAGYVPLTVAMMNNAGSPYYANPQPVNSQILASSAVANVLKQVDPVHGAILTGMTGLPISALQIAPNTQSPPPGTIVITNPGDISTGTPKYSMNFTSVYTLGSTFLKGLRLGGFATIAWETPLFYYYPNGVSAVNSGRVMYYEPTETVFTGLLGYTRKFQHFTFSTQINANNLFNRYHVLLLPSYVNGWAGPNTATFDQQPRMYVWTNTVSF